MLLILRIIYTAYLCLKHLFLLLSDFHQFLFHFVYLALMFVQRLDLALQLAL